VQRWWGHTIADTESGVIGDGRRIGDPDRVPPLAIGLADERREHVREFRSERECEPLDVADRNGSANGHTDRGADGLVESIPIAECIGTRDVHAERDTDAASERDTDAASERDTDAAPDRLAHAVRFHPATLRAVQAHVVRVSAGSRFGMERYERHQFR
jgi:hypothetical protein